LTVFYKKGAQKTPKLKLGDEWAKSLNIALSRFSWDVPDDRALCSELRIAHGLMRSMGWGSSDAPEPADEAGTQRRKGRLNAGTSHQKVCFQQNGTDGDG